MFSGAKEREVRKKKLETYFLSLILYRWTLDFGVFCLQRHACFVVIAFVGFFYCFLERLMQRTYTGTQQLCSGVFLKYVAFY